MKGKVRNSKKIQSENPTYREIPILIFIIGNFQSSSALGFFSYCSFTQKLTASKKEI